MKQEAQATSKRFVRTRLNKFDNLWTKTRAGEACTRGFVEIWGENVPVQHDCMESGGVSILDLAIHHIEIVAEQLPLATTCSFM